MMLSSPVSAIEFSALDLGKGLRLYGNYCIACHGHNGTGSSLAKADIKANMPVFLEKSDATPLRYFEQIYHGGGGMPQMHDELSEWDIWNIVYAIPLIRQQQHSEWAPEKFSFFQKAGVNDGKH
ncbi:MAG: cytochrome c [Mariprofundaceae bacterium]